MLVVLAGGAAPRAALAQPRAAASASAVDDPAGTLDDLRRQLDMMKQQLGGNPPAERLAQLRDQAQAVQARAEQAAGALAPALSNVQARLAELGPAPQGQEAPDVARQRSALESSRGQLEGQVKMARLLGVEADQTGEELSQRRRAHFTAELYERTPSVLSPRFWQELLQGLARDRPRVAALVRETAAVAEAAPLGAWAWWTLAVVIAFGVRRAAGRWLMSLLGRRVPPGRLRRSLLATVVTGLALLTPATFVTGLQRVLMESAVPPSDGLQVLLESLVGAVVFGAYLSGLGRALLAVRRPSWRLPQVPDRVARGLGHVPTELALVIGLGWLAERLATVVNTSLATLVAFNCLFSLALAGLIALSVRRGHVLSREQARAADAAAVPPPRPLWASAVIGLGVLLVVASLVCLLVGFVALGAFIVKQVVWAVLVLATAYLLCTLVDDACMAWVLAPRQPDGAGVPALEGPRLRDQAAVLLSGVTRLAIGLCALVLILAPFGQSPDDLLARAQALREGLAIGEIRLQPGAVLQAVAVFAGGLLAVRALKRWLTQRLLPTTRLDPGMQASAATLTGYLGGVAALAMALSALGLGLERIAWVASALSVGIGFGLQAIVSNFVSGLILLAERPVKVGDWVSLSGVEGDIRRINVRATEIQMGDRSTVIVPNSEFITKIVRNVTHADPMGLVQLRLPLPLDVPADRVREQLQQALDAHDDVLKSPGATVRLDGVDGDKLVFIATGFVASPRKAATVKSDVLFEGLRRLHRIGVLAGAAPAEPIAPAEG